MNMAKELLPRWLGHHPLMIRRRLVRFDLRREEHPENF